MKDEARKSYGVIVSTTDYYIGLVLKKLEEHKLTDNTIVVFMSDNGHSEETGYRIRVDEHKSGYPKGHFYGASGGGYTGKWIGRKGNFLEGGIRVPAIVSYPAKLPKGAVRDQAITAMDWMPTILELCNVPHNGPKMDGHSLVKILHSETAKSDYKDMYWAWGNQWAVRDGDWKLIGNKDRSLSLHNIAEKNPEQKNYIKEKPELVKRLKAMHDVWAKEVQPN